MWEPSEEGCAAAVAALREAHADDEFSYSASLRRHNERVAAEASRREALGPDGRRHEDYGKLWAEMQQGQRR